MTLGFIQNSKIQCITAPEEVQSISNALKARTLMNCFWLECISNEKRFELRWEAEIIRHSYRAQARRFKKGGKKKKNILINVSGFNDPRFIFSCPSDIRLKRCN